MDIKTLLDNLHEEVSCSVCMCKYTDPKQLPCLHSFCLHCLNGIQRTSASRDKIACPECRQEFGVPGNGNLSALPTNFRINSLLDVLAIKECNTTGVKCGNCDKKSDQSFYCFQCSAFWCDDCISLHNGIRANKEHHALALKDFQDQDFENILKRPAFCQHKHHEKEQLKFYCTDCGVSICNSCVATIHDGHAKTVLEGAANERKLQLKLAIESQKQKAQSKMDKMAKLDECCVKIQVQAAKVKTNVEQFADSIMAAIEAKKQGFFVAVENKAKESLEFVGMQKKQIEQQLKMHETAIEKAETILKRSTSAQVMQPNDFLDTILQDEGDRENYTTDPDSGSSVEFTFVKNQRLFDHISVETIGSLLVNQSGRIFSAEGKGISEATVGLEAQMVVMTKNSQGEKYYDERDFVAVEIRNRQGHDCTTKAQVQDNKDGTYKISYFAKETGTCEASVKVNGENVRGSPFEVQVRPRQFRPVLSLGPEGSSVEMFNKPWGVAVDEHNEIIVTDRDNSMVKIFSSNGHYLRSFRSEMPYGIASHHNIIAVTENNRVRILDAHGEFRSQFGCGGNLDHQFNIPLGLSIDSDDNIIVADPRNKSIKIFSPGGQFLRKIGTADSFNFPFHCIQQDNYFVASDAHDHCVKVFNKDGTFLYKFGNKGKGDGEFNEPRCLSVNKTGHLMVCDSLNHRVQVFELNGTFVTKFGCHGSRKGEFDEPTSIAVLGDGKIVVADFCNNCIHIFE